MKRKIINIDKEKCNGCGLCVSACQEGAIGLDANGKAELLRDDYCDGLGNCLPVCPTGAISFEEREAAPFDEKAVKSSLSKSHADREEPVCGCPGMQSKSIRHAAAAPQAQGGPVPSQLTQWPVQIKLAPTRAPYFENANLLIAADCSAYAYGNFHSEFMKNKVTLIGCPKLDEGDYTEKLTEIIRQNEIKSVTIVRMEVPCCGGLTYAAQEALRKSGKFIPWNVVTISTDGQILEN
jgi:NAD-dependent dihydropyrimidine dehydrogenase PreA subunit